MQEKISIMSCFTPACFISICIISRLIYVTGELRPWTNTLPHDVLSLDTSSRLHVDPVAILTASSDYGNIFQEIPSAVLYPSSINDIIRIIKLSYNSEIPFGVAARGRGHSVRGQAMARNGIVVEMMNSLSNYGNEFDVKISWSPTLGYYADVGGGMLWIDVLKMTLEHGLAPMSWTDYLYLTVGGTLSNAGISGQSFHYGPQISNVHELDVITGKGEFMTCSKHMNSELFYAVLGGLGQFGIITRARVALHKAPTRVKWVKMLYENFSTFTRDQEHLISISTDGLDYLEGSIMMRQNPPNDWRSSFFNSSQQSKISSLLTERGILYCIEVVKYYDDQTAQIVEEKLQKLLEGLQYIPDFIFNKDDSFVGFLDRVRNGELELRSMGLWDVPHPWLNLFVPKSRIMDFNAGVFIDILLKQNKTTGPLLVYPTSRLKWDERMSAVTPEEDTFYAVGLLHSANFDDWKALDVQNQEILEFCNKNGIKIKQYLPHFETRQDWMNHFESKWTTFTERKFQFDPKMILSPGQRIFNFV